MRRNPRSGETKYMLDYPNSVCYFIRPWRPVRQISDLQNKRSWKAGERKLLLIIGEQFLALRKVQTLTDIFNDYLKNVSIFVIVIFYICVCVYSFNLWRCREGRNGDNEDKIGTCNTHTHSISPQTHRTLMEAWLTTFHFFSQEAQWCAEAAKSQLRVCFWRSCTCTRGYVYSCRPVSGLRAHRLRFSQVNNAIRSIASSSSLKTILTY